MTDLDLKDLWQQPDPGQPDPGQPDPGQPDPGQPEPELPKEAPAPIMSAEQAESRAKRFERKVMLRNRLEWAAAAFVTLWFGRDAVVAESLGERVGSFLVAAAAVGIAVYLWRRGRVELCFEPSVNTQQFLAAHVAALRAQARLSSRAPLWYLLPLASGMVVLLASRFPEPGTSLLGWAIAATIVVVVFASVGALNHRTAKKLYAEADTLEAEMSAETDTLEGETSAETAI